MNFNYKKTIQVLNFLAKNSNGKIDKLKAIKLIWLIDRLHLRKYGRMITNDIYFAMRLGPVGSFSKDYAGGNVLDEEERIYYDKYISFKDNTITSIRDVEEGIFSDSDKEVMKEIITNYGNCSKTSLINFSHIFPEWSKFKDIIDGGTQREPMDINDFFKNPVEEKTNLKNIFKEADEDLDCSQKRYEESLEVEKCWL
ncbi:MAG: Panacea domain-containing protein [Candidatus Pacearchaeota archaeon]|jgi:uncharacterized phage-associated protein